MALKQTRRSVSLNRSVYDSLRAHCEKEGLSMSQFVEARVTEVLGLDSRPALPQQLPNTRSFRETIEKFESDVATLADSLFQEVNEKLKESVAVGPVSAPAVTVRKKASSFPPKLAIKFSR